MLKIQIITNIDFRFAKSCYQLKIKLYSTQYAAQYVLHLYLYHAIENTANENAGKPLCIRRYTTQHSHEASRSNVV